MSKEVQFHPVDTLSWDINRAERSRQVRWLAPLLDRSEGRVWFLERLAFPGAPDAARAARVFHLCFPLRDIFTTDYYQCRGNPHLEDQLIAYYNQLFDLPEDFGIREVWHTAPGGEIRHPGAGGRAGWYDQFLQGRVPDGALRDKARDVRRMLGTEADALLLTARYVVLIECKYKSEASTEQYERHRMMGGTLARRLERDFHFGMVVDDPRDPRFARIDVPYVLWSEIQTRLEED